MYCKIVPWKNLNTFGFQVSFLRILNRGTPHSPTWNWLNLKKGESGKNYLFPSNHNRQF